MESLKLALESITKREIDRVLDRVSEKYGLSREDLENIYLDREEQSIDKSIHSNNKLAENGVCQGKTKKTGEPCTNKTKSGQLFCGKHLSQK